MPRIYLSPPDISALDHSSVSAVLTSNWVAPVGPHLKEFEAEVSERCGTKHAVALNSGTAALHLALKVLGVGPGDKVVCPSLTFAASANPICYLGAEPIFVDSESRTWNMDPALLEQVLQQEGGVRAVIIVHLYGQCAEMDAILELCQRYNVPLIEDAAEALGATYRGRPAGSMGKLSFFSFNGNKIITTSGGGMLVSDDEKMINEAEYFATQAREPVPHYEHKAIGYNYRMSNVLAGLGISQLADLDRRIAVRRAHFEAYSEAFSDLSGVVMMPISGEGDPNYWLTCLTIDPDVAGTDRNRVIAALGDAEIEARPIWKPLHMQPVFEHSRAYGGACAERLYEHGMCLPSGSSLGEVERAEVIAIVRACF